MIKKKWAVWVKCKKDWDSLWPSDLETYRNMPPIALIMAADTKEEVEKAFHEKYSFRRISDFDIEIKPKTDQELVKVYFETDVHAEAAAVFMGEEIYAACFKSLEAYAKKHRMRVTESVVGIEHDLFEVIEEYLEDDN